MALVSGSGGLRCFSLRKDGESEEDREKRPVNREHGDKNRRQIRIQLTSVRVPFL